MFFYINIIIFVSFIKIQEMSEDIIVITGGGNSQIKYLEYNIGKMNNENVTIYKFKKLLMNEEELRHMKWEV